MTISNVFQRRDIIFIYRNLLLALKDMSCVFRINLFFQVFVSFPSMSYNPDTGIKDPHSSLKL